MGHRIRYSEIFYSIQGEGYFTGTPSVFFRTSFCNLKCTWCDTPYTSFHPENKSITIENAVEEIKKYNCDHVVITGGEPFIQKKPLKLLCDELHKLDKFVTIETNGTIFYPVTADLISCSPKTYNSQPDLEQLHSKREVAERLRSEHHWKRTAPDVLKKFVEEYDHQFKFVVKRNSDLIEIDNIIQSCGVEKHDVFLMPEGRTKEEIEEKEQWIVRLCMEKGYRYSDRLHVKLWGDKRGV